MLLGFLTVVLMAVVAYAYWREGPLTAFAMCCNTAVAGVVAFNFWEPIADAIEPSLEGNFLKGTEDALALMALFAATLMLLRWLTNNLASTHVDYPSLLYRGGALLFGATTGYLAAGFLVCVLQTLPWHQGFLSFATHDPARATPARRLLPPDVVWLAAMHRLSGAGLSAGEGRRFDKNGNFELRYARYRRHDDKGNTLPLRNDLEP